MLHALRLIDCCVKWPVDGTSDTVRGARMFLNISIILLNTAFDDTNTHFTGKHGRNILKRKAQNKARQEKKVLNEWEQQPKTVGFLKTV